MNPHFPSIHIATRAKHNAWFHIVYTDAQNPALQEFIDTDVKNKQLYPFYTFEQDFYDAPLWCYTLFSKPLSFWKGHAYALYINHDEKTIYCSGGIAWGFHLAPLSLYPHTIDPYPIDNNSWLHDRKLLKEKLGEYRILN